MRDVRQQQIVSNTIESEMSSHSNGYYGAFGGAFVAELLISPLTHLAEQFGQLRQDKHFQHQLRNLLDNYAGRPTPITRVDHFSQAIDGPIIYLKREDLLHTGAHKLNNALGQCLLAKIMGKSRIIAETGAGQHGVATAAACAHLKLSCVVYMGVKDMARQAANVQRMQMMGAEVVPVGNENATLKEAVNEALRDWAHNYPDTHYCLGSALGPHPYPAMVAAFQAVIGQECKTMLSTNPDMVVACIGGGSNAIGIFSAYLNDKKVRLIGVEAGGISNNLGDHAARLLKPAAGVLHGCYTYLLQDEEGQIADTTSCAAGLDYPAIGPQHAQLYDTGRVEYVAVNDAAAIAAQKLLSQTEGIIPALESAHALAYVIELAPSLAKSTTVLINLSGRGDKDLTASTLYRYCEESRMSDEANHSYANGLLRRAAPSSQ